MNHFLSGFTDELIKTGAVARTHLTPGSSNIKGFSYNAATQELSVTFKGGGSYRYKGVPANAYKSLRRNKSTGKSLNKLVKAKGYEYEKIAFTLIEAMILSSVAGGVVGAATAPEGQRLKRGVIGAALSPMLSIGAVAVPRRLILPALAAAPIVGGLAAGRIGHQKVAKKKKKQKSYKCKFCKDPATKGVIWAEGHGIVPCCDKHLAKGKASIDDPKDIDLVRDLTKTSANAAFYASTKISPYYAKKQRDKRKQQEANRLLKKAGFLRERVREGNSSDLIGRMTKKRRQIEKMAGACVKTLTWGGLTMKFEYLKDDVRSGTGEGGKKWSRKMQDCYGYIPNTYGQGADGEAIDVYFSPEPLDGPVFRIRQLTKEGKFDEDKFMVGYGSSLSAKGAFDRNMPKWAFGDITALSMKSFRTLVGQEGRKVRVPSDGNAERERVRRAMEKRTA